MKMFCTDFVKKTDHWNGISHKVFELIHSENIIWLNQRLRGLKYYYVCYEFWFTLVCLTRMLKLNNDRIEADREGNSNFAYKFSKRRLFSSQIDVYFRYTSLKTHWTAFFLYFEREKKIALTAYISFPSLSGSMNHQSRGCCLLFSVKMILVISFKNVITFAILAFGFIFRVTYECNSRFSFHCSFKTWTHYCICDAPTNTPNGTQSQFQ